MYAPRTPVWRQQLLHDIKGLKQLSVHGREGILAWLFP